MRRGVDGPRGRPAMRDAVRRSRARPSGRRGSGRRSGRIRPAGKLGCSRTSSGQVEARLQVGREALDAHVGAVPAAARREARPQALGRQGQGVDVAAASSPRPSRRPSGSPGRRRSGPCAEAPASSDDRRRHDRQVAPRAAPRAARRTRASRTSGIGARNAEARRGSGRIERSSGRQPSAGLAAEDRQGDLAVATLRRRKNDRRRGLDLPRPSRLGSGGSRS